MRGAAKRWQERVGHGDHAEDVGFVGATKISASVSVTEAPVSSEMPALLTKTSSSGTELAAAAIVSTSVTSSNTAWLPNWAVASAPRVTSRARTKTVHPRSAN